MKYILVTDVGSTTTKARFFHNIEGEWRYLVSGETPTTVEAPFEDVTFGVRNAIKEVQELTGHQILSEDEKGIIVPCTEKIGVDLYCTTSSAGGGLQMMVAGVIKSMTGESANRAALGAGAIVMDVIAIDDGRAPHSQIQRIRNLRPDMILLAGGTDGGADSLVLDIVELVKAADPKARLGTTYELPIVYAGNTKIHNKVKYLLDKGISLKFVENIRPILEIENIEPSRRAIHEEFMEHVMSHAPGYKELMKWIGVDIMPTPGAEGIAMQFIAKNYNTNVLGVGLGGATTNIYSVFEDRFVRSVSANLGMSYSICNVLKETGIQNIIRWLPFNIGESDIKNRLANKMIRPTTIPQTINELLIEHSIAREAIRLGFEHHKSIATRLKGMRTEVGVSRILEQEISDTYIDLMKINVIVGTGGLLSHAPRRIQSLLTLTDAFQPEGVTTILQDSVFMMPHLGLLSTVQPEAAWNIFDKDCLVRLGTVIAPKGLEKEDNYIIDVNIETSGGDNLKKKLKFGEIAIVPLQEGEKAHAVIQPHRGFDVGVGKGRKLEKTIEGGIVGVVIDARGRPIIFPEDRQERMRKIIEWFKSLKIYPDSFLLKWEDQ